MQNNDLISREALLDIVGKMPLDWEYGKAVSDIYDIIKNAPSVDAVPVVHGRWIDTSPNYRNGYYNNAHKCSNCGDYYTTDPNDLYYCPRCGAKMDM